MSQTSKPEPRRFLPETFDAPPPAACIGLIADTHLPQRLAALPPALFDVLAGVDLLLHAGDVGELAVLDELSALAPVTAVHGNDEAANADEHLPLKQLAAVTGRRVLLWHSHFPERAAELADRKVDDLRPKLARLADHGRAAGAEIVVFGHWHVPLAQMVDGVLLVNPGALASGNFVTRQTIQTVALLFLWVERPSRVVHVNLAAPDKPYNPAFDAAAGFQAGVALYSASILSPAVTAVYEQLLTQIFPQSPAALPALYLRLAHRCWAGEQEVITPRDLVEAAERDTGVAPAVVGQLQALF